MFAVPRLKSLLLGVAGLALLAGQASAQDLQKLTVVLGYIPDVESFGPVYAKEKGFFKDEGLDVTVVPAGVGVDQVQMVSSGAATIGIVGPELILAGESKGEKFKVFAGEFQRSPVAMTCSKASGVAKPSDLKGKTLGIKTTAAAYADLFLQKNGVAKSDVKTMAIGPNDISTIVAGRIDCMITTFAFNEPRLIEDAGVPVNVISLGDYGLNNQMNSYFVKADFYDKPGSKEILAKYLRAEVKAWQQFFKDPAGAAKFLVDGGYYDGLDLDQQVYQAQKQGAYMTSPLTKEKGLMWLDPAVWKETAQNANDAHLTDGVVDTSDILTTDILEMAKPPKL
ncbi:ABC transporter substrate-binding protein [Faunimonas pinastri]|nr:ABC transporter substrate-binding protein [Faunimonas pinastri]